jgi:hypothetical protein
MTRTQPPKTAARHRADGLNPAAPGVLSVGYGPQPACIDERESFNSRNPVVVCT